MPFSPTNSQLPSSAPPQQPIAAKSETGTFEPSTSSSATQTYGTRPSMLRPDGRPLSLSSFDTSAGSDFSLGLGLDDRGDGGGGGGSVGRTAGKAVRFGEGAKANRTATQSMADFLRNVPPPPSSDVLSPTRSTSSVQDKIRKTPVRLFGIGRSSSSKEGDVAKSPGSGNLSNDRLPTAQNRGQVKGLQQVITPSGQTVHLIPYRSSAAGGIGPPSLYDAQKHHHTSPSVSSEASAVPSDGSGGPPILPELRTLSEDEYASDDFGHRSHPSPSLKSGFRGVSSAQSSARSSQVTSRDATRLDTHLPRSHSDHGPSFLAPPSPDSPQSRRTLSRSSSSPSMDVPRIVIPLGSRAEAEPPSPGSARFTKDALREQEAVTLEILGQRIERDDHGDLVLGRRVSKRTVGSQTTASAVRSLLEMSRERTPTGRSAKSTETAVTNIPPSPAVARATGKLTFSSPTEGRRRNVSVDPDSSIVGGESDGEEPPARSATSTGTFGPRSPALSATSAPPTSPMPPPPPVLMTAPPSLVSSDPRGSMSSITSGSSWSGQTPSLPALPPAAAAFGSHGMRKSPSSSRLRPSGAPTSSLTSSVDATRERELLEARLRSIEERLALETEKRREAERKLKRLQVSSREGRARWEDMAGWAVEVIESADKDRHLLGLENARLQRTVELYRNQFGNAEPLLPAQVSASDATPIQPS